jgi:hypothetical protein
MKRRYRARPPPLNGSAQAPGSCTLIPDAEKSELCDIWVVAISSGHYVEDLLA